MKVAASTAAWEDDWLNVPCRRLVRDVLTSLGIQADATIFESGQEHLEKDCRALASADLCAIVKEDCSQIPFHWN